MEPMTPPSRSESVIIYASKDVKQLPLTLVPSPISQISSPIYYFDSNQLVNCNLVSLDSSEKHTDSSESSINLFDVASTIQLSPVSDDFSSENHIVHHHRTKLKRGRPKLETITSQMESNGGDAGGDIVPSIRCNICRRSFPREKSLQAHIRIHTGERPYLCDFPDCGRRFAQSGQLRTHQRLHTGEKPFVCNFEGCENRFTHANRRCPAHPMVGVSRDKEACSPQSILKPNASLSNASKEVADWLSDYYRSVKRQGIKRSKEGSSRPFKGRKLDLDLDAADMGNSSEENSAPVWKKKRAALQLQAKKESIQKQAQDLGPSLDHLPNDRLLGALALMELANCPVVDLDVKCRNVLNASYETLNTSFNSSFNCSLTENNTSLVSERHDYSTEDHALSSSLDDIVKKEAIA